MNIYFFIFLILSFILCAIYISKQASKSLHDSDDYYLSGRNLGTISLCLTFLATQFGGGAIIGAADAAYLYGWQALYYSLGICLGFFVLSFGLGRNLRSKNISTVPQVFQDIYQDKFVYKFASVIYIISTFFILVAIAISAKKYLISIGYFNNLLFFALWCLIITYTSLGGLSAVVKTDILRIICVLVVFMITYIYILLYSNIATINIVVDKMNTVPLGSWLLVPFCFTLIGQDMGQRCFSANSNKSISKGTFLAGILLLIASTLPVYIGIIARQIPFVYNPDSSVLLTTIAHITNPLITTLFAFAVLMAIISTADSLLCAISSNVMIDIFNNINQPSKQVLYAKIVTFACGCAAYFCSFYLNDIIQLMIKAYEVTIICFFIPIILAIFYPNPNKLAARASIIAGIAYYLLAENVLLLLPHIVICLLTSLITFIIATVMVKKASITL